jgi:hypothetical protein
LELTDKDQEREKEHKEWVLENACRFVNDGQVGRIFWLIKEVLRGRESVTIGEIDKGISGIEPVIWCVAVLAAKGYVNCTQEENWRYRVITMTSEQKLMKYE